MNKESMDMFDAMNFIYNVKDIEEMSRYTKRVSPQLTAVLGVVKELILVNQELFDSIFVMNYSDKKKVKVVAAYMKLNPDSLTVAKDKQEIIRFSGNIMTYEALAKMYETVKTVCAISRKEFAVSWMMLTRTGELMDLLFLRKHELSDLSEDAAILYKRKDEKFNIADILADAEDVTLEEQDEG